MTVYITHHEINDEGMPVPGGGADAVVHNRKDDGSFAEYPIKSGGRTGNDMTRSCYEELKAAKKENEIMAALARKEREKKEKARKEKEERERERYREVSPEVRALGLFD